MTKFALIVAGTAGVAAAQPLISFTYSDLEGAFNSGSSVMTANAVDAAFQTSGDVTRLAGATANAEFGAGFKSSGGDVNITLNVSGITSSTANGAGTFTLTDADNDTISGDISGVFSGAGPFIGFVGSLSNVVITSDDGTFDGTAGSFSTSFAASGPYTGAIVELTFGAGSFFSGDFSGASTQISGEILPTPGAAALASLGGLLGLRRRR